MTHDAGEWKGTTWLRYTRQEGHEVRRFVLSAGAETQRTGSWERQLKRQREREGADPRVAPRRRMRWGRRLGALRTKWRNARRTILSDKQRRRDTHLLAV